MADDRICGLCRQPMRGYAKADDVWLCHDQQFSCYHLVTVYRVPLPDGRVWGRTGWLREVS